MTERKTIENRRTVLGTEEVDYVLKRNLRSRRVYFYIDDRGLRVSVPWRTPDQLLNHELNKHSGWILQKMADWRERKPPTVEWEQGTLLRYLGAELRLSLVTSERDVAPWLVARDLYLPVAHPRDQTRIRDRVETWYREQARARFSLRAAHYAAQLSVQVQQLCLSNARTAWGNCSADGVIRIIWRLIQAPEHLIDYVIAHEVAHLVQMNHSAKFWKTVEKIYPDYVNARTELNAQYPKYLLI